MGSRFKHKPREFSWHKSSKKKDNFNDNHDWMEVVIDNVQVYSENNFFFYNHILLQKAEEVPSNHLELDKETSKDLDPSQSPTCMSFRILMKS